MQKINDFSIKYWSKNLFEILYYYDVLGYYHSVFLNGKLNKKLFVTHNLCTFVFKYTEFLSLKSKHHYMDVITKFFKKINSIFKGAWLVNISKCSDTINITIGFYDNNKLDPDILNPDIIKPGNNIKFLCDCGNFKNKIDFLYNYNMSIMCKNNNHIGIGFYYLDQDKKCSEYVSMGNGRYFQSASLIKTGYFSNKSTIQSFYTQSVYIDKTKINIIKNGKRCPLEEFIVFGYLDKQFNSIEEFKFYIEVIDNLKIGDAFYLDLCDRQSQISSIICCWDGKQWIKYDIEHNAVLN